MAVSIRLDPEIELRLDQLAAQTGRAKSYYLRKVLAYAYTADGKPLANYVGEAEKFGFLDIKPELHLQAAYFAAMQAVSDKMQADPKFQSALKAEAFSKPCATTALLPEPKIQFMSF